MVVEVGHQRASVAPAVTGPTFLLHTVGLEPVATMLLSSNRKEQAWKPVLLEASMNEKEPAKVEKKIDVFDGIDG